MLVVPPASSMSVNPRVVAALPAALSTDRTPMPFASCRTERIRPILLSGMGCGAPPCFRSYVYITTPCPIFVVMTRV